MGTAADLGGRVIRWKNLQLNLATQAEQWASLYISSSGNTPHSTQDDSHTP
jgi:hypothetical protein